MVAIAKRELDPELLTLRPGEHAVWICPHCKCEEVRTVAIGPAPARRPGGGLDWAVLLVGHRYADWLRDVKRFRAAPPSIQNPKSEHLGVTVTFYEQMGQACQKAGIETEALARGMERIQRGLGDWKQSTLGPRTLSREDPEKQFKSAIQNAQCGAVGSGAFVTPFDRCRRLFKKWRVASGFVNFVSFVVSRVRGARGARRRQPGARLGDDRPGHPAAGDPAFPFQERGP